MKAQESTKILWAEPELGKKTEKLHVVLEVDSQMKRDYTYGQIKEVLQEGLQKLGIKSSLQMESCGSQHSYDGETKERVKEKYKQGYDSWNRLEGTLHL